MEHERFDDIRSLRERGWTVDDECQRLQMADDRMGGPTFMKDTLGRVHEVSVGEAVLLSGMRKRTGGPRGTLVGVYDNGVLVAEQG